MVQWQTGTATWPPFPELRIGFLFRGGAYFHFAELPPSSRTASALLSPVTGLVPESTWIFNPSVSAPEMFTKWVFDFTLDALILFGVKERKQDSPTAPWNKAERTSLPDGGQLLPLGQTQQVFLNRNLKGYVRVEKTAQLALNNLGLNYVGSLIHRFFSMNTIHVFSLPYDFLFFF